MRHAGANETIDRRVRRGWFAETLVVLGILAFAFFAMTLQGQQASGPAPRVPALLEIG
jgi:hypothetical protein